MKDRISFAYPYKLFPSDLAVANNGNALGPDFVAGSLRQLAFSSNGVGWPNTAGVLTDTDR